VRICHPRIRLCHPPPASSSTSVDERPWIDGPIPFHRFAQADGPSHRADPRSSPPPAAPWKRTRRVAPRPPFAPAHGAPPCRVASRRLTAPHRPAQPTPLRRSSPVHRFPAGRHPDSPPGNPPALGGMHAERGGGMKTFHATTIVAVRHDGRVALGGDGQVTLGDTVIKATAQKVRRLKEGRILAGFAGSVADAFTLFEKFEEKLERHPGNLPRACVELAKEWRTDRYLRRLEALLTVADR